MYSNPVLFRTKLTMTGDRLINIRNTYRWRIIEFPMQMLYSVGNTRPLEDVLRLRSSSFIKLGSLVDERDLPCSFKKIPLTRASKSGRA